MRIVCSYKDNKRVWETPETEVVFGRAEDKSPIVLDLSPDQRVSRLHGRIWLEDGQCWIEDLNSSRGTLLNGVEIKGSGRQPFRLEDSVVVGQTTMRIEFDESPGAGATNYLEHGTILLPEKHHAASGVAIAKDVDATAVEPMALPADCAEDSASRRLKMVCDLPFQFATKLKLESLLPAIVDQLVQMIPSGESWALVLRDPATDTLLLKAYQFVQRTYLSETLLRRAMNDRKAFVWKRNVEVDISGSMAESGMEVGMYAPLLWQGEALGAICAGAQKSDAVFTDEDVRLLVVVGQYAAMAVATHRLQEKLRQESVIKANLLRQFSPKVADELLTHRGRLRLGGQRNEVTILNADIRRFTQLVQEMEPDNVVEMLNDYFAVAVPIIFSFRGTIDKFIGDAILAVFGSPEPDAKQHANAIRAALEIQSAIKKLNVLRTARGEPTREFGIGIHCGEVVHGFVGTADRMEFTVIGDAVNRAARYCAAAAGGEVLISPEVHERVWQVADAEKAVIPTKHEGDFAAYRVRSIKDDTGAGKNPNTAVRRADG
jgi:adenylate cyclase